LWTAGSQDNRPHAYCRVVRINEASKQVVDEPDVWSADRACCRAHAPSNDTWIAAGYTLEGGEDRTNIVPRFVHFALAP
jgi:hypothetical protein